MASRDAPTYGTKAGAGGSWGGRHDTTERGQLAQGRRQIEQELEKAKAYAEAMRGMPGYADAQGRVAELEKQAADLDLQHGAAEAKDAYDEERTRAEEKYGRAEDAYEDLFGDGGSLTTPGYLEERYEQRRDSDAPGYLENFYESALTGENPALQRMQQEGLDTIAQRMQARGGLVSGSTALAEGDFLSDLYADNFMNLGNLAGGADQARGARQGALDNLAGTAQGAKQSRQGSAFDAAIGLGSGQSSLSRDFGMASLGTQNQYNMADIERRYADYDRYLQQQAAGGGNDLMDLATTGAEWYARGKGAKWW